MYEIVMSNGDRAECETVAACLTAAATLAEDSGWESRVAEVFRTRDSRRDSGYALVPALNWHISEVRATDGPGDGTTWLGGQTRNFS